MASNAKNLAEYLNNETTSASADIADGSITTDKLAADAVTAAKLADNAVVSANLSAGTLEGSGVNLGRRNLVINGAMHVAQRGTSSTAAGYQTVDRMSVGFAGHDEAPTISQADVASGTPAYTTGFRKSLKIQNGNQTSGAGAADELALTYSFEGQDIFNSSWDVSSTSSYVTLSFWVKSSVAQQFQTNVRLYGPANGNQREFAFAYTLSANTWTKVTKSIPGHASNTVRGDNALGMFLQFPMFWGTNYTANARNHDTWEAKNNAQNMKDYVSTWWTTNDATWEITGIQLEVGSTATDFEHRSFQEELDLCHRYFYNGITANGTGTYGAFPINFRNFVSTGNNGHIAFTIALPKPMRTIPTFTHDLANSNHAGSGVGANADNWQFYMQNQGWGSFAGNGNMNTLSRQGSSDAQVQLGTYYISPSSTSVDQLTIGSNRKFHFSAEL